jgi:hypothetical protein
VAQGGERRVVDRLGGHAERPLRGRDVRLRPLDPRARGRDGHVDERLGEEVVRDAPPAFVEALAGERGLQPFEGLRRALGVGFG